MNDGVSSRVLSVRLFDSCCSVRYLLPDGNAESSAFMDFILRKMNYLQAIGFILDTVEKRTGGISELEKVYLVKYLRDYLMNITL